MKTGSFAVPGTDSRVIVEEGAEGFVTRSTVFPEVARFAGLLEDDLVNQQRIADCEIQFDSATHSWNIQELEAGVAAQKLGFQVPEKDRGKGIRSFRGGMSQLVESIGNNVTYQTSRSVQSLHASPTGFELKLGDLEGSSLNADAVVIATPLTSMLGILRPLDLEWCTDPLSHHSHVSIHLLFHKGESRLSPRSFTIPQDLQQRFGGLRACSLVNEKFPGRCQDDHWLFRFYFRPNSTDTVDDADYWVRLASRAAQDVFGIRTPVLWSRFSPWSSALPTLTQEHLRDCTAFKELLLTRFRGRLAVIGSEVSGAGLEAAATSGYEAALQVIDSA